MGEVQPLVQGPSVYELALRIAALAAARKDNDGA